MSSISRESNPWRTVRHDPPFVALADQPHIEVFVEAYEKDWKLDTTVPPDPWLGCWDAPVVLLQMNPSLGHGDDTAYTRHDVRSLNRRNLIDEAGTLPHYWLDPALSALYAGRWWNSRLAALIRECGLDAVRERLLVLEFHGYHASKHAPLPITLDSQRFTFSLLEDALERGAVVVMNRALLPWKVAVPALNRHPAVVLGKSPRNSYITPGCLSRGVEDFRILVDAIHR